MGRKKVLVDDMPFSLSALRYLRLHRVSNSDELLRFLQKPDAFDKCDPHLSTEIREISKPYFAEDKDESEQVTPKIEQHGTLLGRRFLDEEILIAQHLKPNEFLYGRALTWANSSGLMSLFEVANQPISEVLAARNLGRKTVSNIRSAIEHILASIKKVDGKLSEYRLHEFVEVLLEVLDPRTQRIIRWRNGFWSGQGLTLLEIGDRLGVTRERIRQIELKAKKRLNKIESRKKLEAYIREHQEKSILEFLLKRHGFAKEEQIIEDFFGRDKRARLAKAFLESVYSDPWKELIPSGLILKDGIYFVNSQAEDLFEKVKDSIKLELTSKGRPLTVKFLAEVVQRNLNRNLSKYLLKQLVALTAEFQIDAEGKIGLARWKFMNPSGISEMIHRTLLELGHPAHFTTITERMNILFPQRAPFSENSVHNRLHYEKNMFVRVDSGTYALADWGIPKRPYIKDFLAAALRKKGGQAFTADLVAEGRAQYGFKESSMKMTLNMTPRVFKMLPGGICKLVEVSKK